MDKATENKDAIELLEADHKKVKGLFKEFEEAEEAEDQESVKRIVEQSLQELRIHTTVEEEIFYPAVAGALSDDDEALLEEAKEEHHVAKSLIAELEGMDGSEDNYCAKFTVLAENVRHHVKEEENEMFPKVKKSGLDLDALGRKMALRKEVLEADGVPLETGASAAPSRSAQNAGQRSGAKKKRS